MSGASSGSLNDLPLAARDSGERQTATGFDPSPATDRDDVARPHGPPRARRWRSIALRVFIGLAVLAAGGAIAAFVLYNRKAEEKPVVALPPVVRAVVVAPAAAGVARYTGVVHARYESNLGFRVAGKILTRLVDPGDHVTVGQPLMKLDETDLDLALRAARSAVDAARATAVQTASDQQRRLALVDRGWVSQQAYELNKSAADAAAAQLASALSQQHEADNQLSYAILRADSDGVITRVPGEPGQVVAAAQPVLQLAHQGSREAEVYLPEGEEQNAHAPATAELYALADATFPASLRELSAAADPATRTYRARYVLGGRGKDAPLGSTVTISLSEPKKSIQKVPIGAVFDDGRGTAVWVVDDASQTIARRAVTVVSTGEEQAMIKGGLKGGETVVALGAQLLRDDEKVRVDMGPRDTSVARPNANKTVP